MTASMKRKQDRAQHDLIRWSTRNLHDDLAVSEPLADLRPSVRLSLRDRIDAAMEAKLNAYFQATDAETEETLS